MVIIYNRDRVYGGRRLLSNDSPIGKLSKKKNKNRFWANEQLRGKKDKRSFTPIRCIVQLGQEERQRRSMAEGIDSSHLSQADNKSGRSTRRANMAMSD